MQLDIVDFVFLIVTLITAIVTFSLAVIILKKDQTNIINRLFFFAFLSMALGMSALGVGDLLTKDMDLFLSKIAYTAIFLAALVLMAAALTLNYGEGFWNWPIILVLIGAGLIPFILLLLIPGSMYFPDPSLRDVSMLDELALIYYPLVLIIGVITIWLFVLLYRQTSGTIKKRFQFFTIGYIVTLVGGAVPDLLANMLTSRFFDVLSTGLIGLGCVIIFIGFTIRE
ncbi:MAG: hypothetical protein ACFFC7_31265 [Candidatus Hermodarchaeota archaeon]